MSFALLACMDGSRRQPLKPLCSSRHFGFPSQFPLAIFNIFTLAHLLKNTAIVGYTRRFWQSASTWLAQRALCVDVVLSSSTTCSKRISSMCRGSSWHGAVYSSESSSANSSDKLNTPQVAGHSRIVKSASVAFTNNSALQVCLSRLQADKVRSCRWQSHAGRELPQQEGRRPKDRSAEKGG